MRDVALYIHIPFCKRRCAYCDFNAYSEFNEIFRDDYCRALLRDICLEASEDCYRLKSVYIGGGTPSLIKSAWLCKLLAQCRQYFVFPDDIEVSIEANPGTVDIKSMSDWLGGGINRVSFGVQSLDCDLLKLIGRIHDRETALRSVRMARQVGFNNINIDLMYGLPTQTIGQWVDTLERMLAEEPEHISVYELCVEKGTALAKNLESGLYRLPDEEQEEFMEERLLSELESRGYCHYEISNWCRPGYSCKHNELYWANGEYIGVGCGAVSFIDGWRYTRVRDPRSYMMAIDEGRIPVIEAEMLDGDDRLKETIILGLRTAKGVNLRILSEKFGKPLPLLWNIWKKIPGELWERNGDTVRLTQCGWDLSNEVFVRYIL